MAGKLAAAGAAVVIAAALTGCGQETERGRLQTEQETGAAPAGQTETPTERETVTELYEIETETDLFGQVEMRSIWEVMPEQTRLWAAGFEPDQAKSVTYTTYMEEGRSIVITDPEQIGAIFDAIDQMTVAGALPSPARQGDVFVFAMKDGTQEKLAFSLSCIVVDGTAYETDHTEQLWELTGNLLFGEEETWGENEG